MVDVLQCVIDFGVYLLVAVDLLLDCICLLQILTWWLWDFIVWLPALVGVVVWCFTVLFLWVENLVIFILFALLYCVLISLCWFTDFC